jgi:hypothetical protein
MADQAGTDYASLLARVSYIGRAHAKRECIHFRTMHWQTQKTEPIAARHLRRPQFHHFLLLALLCVLSTLFLVAHLESATNYLILHKHRPKNAADIIARCRQLAMPAASPPNFHSRSRSDRFEEGTRPILIQNARIWTGNKNGTEVVHADILLDKGLIKSIGHLRGFSIQHTAKNLSRVDAKGSWVTPGLVDLHSHLGVDLCHTLAVHLTATRFMELCSPG